MIDEMNYHGTRRIPFIFIIDFDKLNPVIIPVQEAASNDIYFSVNGYSNFNNFNQQHENIILTKYPPSFPQFKKAFDRVVNYLRNGYSYLLNLTFPVKIELNLNQQEVFNVSKAKYKLLFKDDFVVFSPETFVRITGRGISAYPMKGTIDAAVPDAEKIIMEDKKELAEHVTIVDLLRNDLSMVAADVHVEKFRYIEKIHTSGKDLLQVSSEITGTLEYDYPDQVGNIIDILLPAGSITGAPKTKTVEIIKEVEGYNRGYYTGVFGYFDGKSLDSCVMIRFIENTDGSLFYKSGGGITVYSDAYSEYRELIDKIYVPVN